MKSFLRGSLLSLLLAASSPLFAQSINELSNELGGIERGFWTRPVSNEMSVQNGVLEIRRYYRTIVEWAEPGVPSRMVSDALTWQMPLVSLNGALVRDVPGEALLEGGDQDTYCPLTVVEFSCSTRELECGDDPKFYTCRYNKAELFALLEELQEIAPNLVVTADPE